MSEVGEAGLDGLPRRALRQMAQLTSIPARRSSKSSATAASKGSIRKEMSNGDGWLVFVKRADRSVTLDSDGTKHDLLHEKLPEISSALSWRG